MELHVVAVGRVKDPGLRAACEAYAGRVARYFPLHTHEVAEAGRKGPTPATSMRVEAERLRARIPERTVLVACTREGKHLDSAGLARQLGRWQTAARDVTFLLGGAWGLEADLVRAADLRLAVSAMTLPHELARVVLLEQLYRAGTILRGEPYHKGPSLPERR